MTRNDLVYTPHNFAELSNEDIINQHALLINSSLYEEAVDLLNQNPNVEGMRASIFNKIEQEIILIDGQLEVKTKPELIYYSPKEPTDYEFANKVIWAQEY